MATKQGPQSTALDDRGFPRFWDEERETLPREQRDELILGRMQQQLQYVYEQLPFYRRHYDAHGFHPADVKSLADFTSKVPVITKQMLVADQLEHPPFGSYTATTPTAPIPRIHASSVPPRVPPPYA